jgi:hypothetical protein
VYVGRGTLLFYAPRKARRGRQSTPRARASSASGEATDFRILRHKQRSPAARPGGWWPSLGKRLALSFRAPIGCMDRTPRAVMPAEGGVIGRDFRKRDEEKFARHLGLLPNSSGAALVRSTPGCPGRRGGRRTFVLAGGCRINDRRCWRHTTRRSAPRELWRCSSHIRGSIAKVRPPATGRAGVGVCRAVTTDASHRLFCGASRVDAS